MPSRKCDELPPRLILLRWPTRGSAFRRSQTFNHRPLVSVYHLLLYCPLPTPSCLLPTASRLLIPNHQPSKLLTSGHVSARHRAIIAPSYGHLFRVGSLIECRMGTQ